MITKDELEPIMDDMKLIARAVKVMGQENDQIKRAFAMQLVEDLFNRLEKDIRKLKEKDVV